eukprot:CAMPEP_0113474726 /NCGR_PEP_ID=MMETSP0014_2-20120614/18741_1 /TAXON_ID=2857 /ORGANISM="Nitzschia sp." /LENGTH=863 /DNA_ID=CAMNT_0000367599 /DNA_START=114 /DNA_END=2705 /DNA_ORIENTATION=+ /assembly_acc=CAM_ASM_000159
MANDTAIDPSGIDGVAADGGVGVGVVAGGDQQEQQQQQLVPDVSLLRSASSDDVDIGYNDNGNEEEEEEVDGQEDVQEFTNCSSCSRSFDCGYPSSDDNDQFDEHEFSDSDASSVDDNSSSAGNDSGQRRRHSSAAAKHEDRMLPYENLTTTQSIGINFAMEHRIFLRALLGLLNEREKTATETGMNDPNIIKCGPLKKASHLLSGVWKVKYVEIRRGMFSYFEDVASSSTTTNQGGGGGGGGTSGLGGGDNAHNTNSNNNGDSAHQNNQTTESLLQKNIPLDSNECQVMPVKIHRNGLNMAPGGAIFELKVGNTGRLWLARTRAERAAWIEAINEAMVGGSVTQGGGSGSGGGAGSGGTTKNTNGPGTLDARGTHGKSGTVDSRSPYRHDLRLFLKTKTALKNSKTKEEYMTSLSKLVGHDDLSVPVRWIMLQVENNSSSGGGGGGGMPGGNFMNLARTTSGIGSDDEGGGAFAESDISKSVDQLWRDLQRDSIRINTELFLGDSGHGPDLIVGALTRDIVTTSRSESNYRYAIPESKAVAYARDILLSINRTRSGGDSYFCLNTLCNNPDLCILVPSSREAEPLSISVELDESDNLAEHAVTYKTGWIRTRNRIQTSWRKRFFIMTEGTLSFYRYQKPRPHDMRGQTVLTDATISVDESKDRPGYYVITIVPKDGIKERFLYFNNVDKLLSWAYALECSTKSFSRHKKRSGRQPRPPTSTSATAATPSKDESSKSTDKTTQDISDAMWNHARRLGLEEDEVEDTLARLSARSFSRVRISVKASTEYKICTTDPQGEDSDTWSTLTATFLQIFRITGGRIVRGEEMVQVGLSDLSESLAAEASGKSEGSAPSSPRRKLGRRR